MSGKSKEKTAAVHPIPPVSPAGEMPEEEVSRPPKSESPAAGLNDRWQVAGVCIFLAAITFAVFGQTLRHEFVNFDDGLYVYEDPVVQKGLTREGIVLAFTHVYASNWHPLTMMSHMLDCRLYALNAGGHHLTSVLLHTASVLLLFLVLRRMTGCLGRSAFVAAVFAIHPLRVESVAWVAERKDVLSGLFFMLTLWAWVRYVEKTKGQRPKAKVFYGLALLLFALGLMSKPMVVTLPFVLLLLDYWPLGRVTGGGWRVAGADSRVAPHTSRLTPRISHLLLEKLPLLGLAVASCVVTLFAQHEAMQSSEKVSLPLRLGNAAISYVAYLGQMFWPSGLAVLYPFTAGSVGLSKVVLSLVLLAGISGGVFVLRRRRPYLLTGWLWYLIMLAPVIGVLQVGWQARADRYTYLPQIGLYVLLAWAAADLCAGWRHRRVVLGGLATVILVGLIFCARAQTSYWRNSESLWTHTLACTSGNVEAHNNLGSVLLKMGRVDEAIAQYQQALQIKPDNAEVHNNLGNVLLQKGQVDEAIVHYQKTLQIKPDSAEAHNNLGNALLQKGRVDEAIAQYQKTLQIKPDSAGACYNLGNVLLKKGQVDEAIVHFQKAMQIKPDYAEAHYILGNILLRKGDVDEAIAYFQKTLQIKPDSLDVLNNLAWLLATSPDAHIRDGVQAVKYAERACELTHYGVTLLVGTLAAAYAEAGRYDDAIAAAQKACALAAAAGEQGLLRRNQDLLALYLKHQPYHEAAGKPAPGAP
ncbi:MAG: tetratricopeptide repeat protein [Verrucomicrobiota bacterium]|jgi:tetratricopeptide (TPR) repeat protein